jgi:hydrogenase-4 component F
MTALLLLPIVASAGAAAAALTARPRAAVRLTGVVTSAVVLATGLLLLAVTARGEVPEAGGLLRADALSAFLLATIGAVGLTATWGGLDGGDGRAVFAVASAADRRVGALVPVFLGAMSVAVLTDNLGVLWVAVEATTITTAFLVGHHGTRRALEAAWKYVVLGSVGVAVALLGIVLLYAASRAAGTPTLSWSLLASGDLVLDPGLVRVAAGLAVLGLATKAGLAPLHSWLPDAHSQAPAPVSGLMSGVLLAVAFSGVLRVQAIADVVLGPGLVRGMLVVGGLGSLAVAAALVLRQRDHKRLLAYSSIEHMGVLALGAAVGGKVAIAAVLLHALGHGLAKAVLFVVAGRVLEAEGTTAVADLGGLLRSRPDLAVPYAAAMAALLGFPPFALFFTEVAIVLAGWRAGLGWAMGAALVLLLVVLAGLVRATWALLLGDPSDGREVLPSGPGQAALRGRGPTVPLVLALGTCAVVGLLAWPVGSALVRAAAALGAA